MTLLVLMSQTLVESRHPEPVTNLVERLPVKEGVKLFKSQTTWEDLRGLSWLFLEDWGCYDE
ncbi:MAG: hypothetical protein K5793_07840 [Nitrosarchaeum sp.]|nr:hypothetical protein [Nitrosarchaeum sp.]